MNEPVAAPASATSPISVVSALSDAVTYVVQGFPNLFRLSWKFLVFVVAVAALLFVIIGFLARQENEIAIYFVVGIGLLSGFLVSVVYYIVVTRNFLLGEPSPNFLAVFGPFLLRVLALTFLILAAMTAIFVPPFLIGLAVIGLLSASGEPPVWLVVVAIIALIALAIFAVVAAIYLGGRLIPWMVAAAAEKPQTLMQAWRATKGAGLRILGGMLGLTIFFMIIDVTIEASLSPLLGVSSEAFEKIASGASLPALFVLLLVKVLVFFPQTAASMVYCASIYRQASGR
ncbi:MAG: hypothetical protein K2P86_04085 [Xanthobacteraceae bacterium]|nr:hypothetical protein [Xanthobacteraceae bacterium]